ncbi:hypothetical protein AB0H83_34435 [Dactylosporangium sp. NPDC050688]|uniref:hypothetical protein n=1 Tax=Dactylosporangium sp. NPDC050688 TaxID=3157217 RepID=UPI0033E39917
MRATVLQVFAVVVLLGGVAGCEQEAGSSASGATTTASGGQATDKGGQATGKSGDAKAVCAAVDGDIKAILPKVAEAEAIGPPAGHHAVSAAYSAGAAVIYSHITEAGGGPVAGAAKQVADAMGAIADKYVDAMSKPDKAPLNAAIEAFRAACA